MGMSMCLHPSRDKKTLAHKARNGWYARNFPDSLALIGDPSRSLNITRLLARLTGSAPHPNLKLTNTVRHTICLTGEANKSSAKIGLSKKVRDFFDQKSYVMVKTSNPNLEAP